MRYAALVACLVAVSQTLNGIVAPDTVAADIEFQVTFENANSDQYRVYLAAALTGVNGPTCTSILAGNTYEQPLKRA